MAGERLGLAGRRATLDAVRRTFAGSSQAAAAVGGLYQAVLGRTVDAGSLASVQATLAGGATLAQVRRGVAGSAEAAAAISAAYGQVLGRAADPSGLATYQGVLAQGGSLADVAADLAGSAEGLARAAALHPAATAASTAAPAAASAAVQPDPGMTQVAANLLLAVQRAQAAGNADQVQLASTAYRLATKIAELPPAARGGPAWGMSASVKDRDGHTVDVIVYDDTSGRYGPTGHVIYHDKPNDAVLGTVEQAIGLVADALSFVPGVNAVAIPVAIAVGAAEGGQDLASGNILGGVLAIAGAAAGGVGTWASGAVDSAMSGVAEAASAGSLAGVQAASAALSSAQDVLAAAQAVSRGVAAAQGVAGVVQGARDGDALAAITSAAGGLAGSAYAGTDIGAGLAVGSALAGAGVAAAGGNVLSALAATETAAAGAGLFNGIGGASQPAQDQGASAAGTPDGQAAPVGWQNAAPVPVQQQPLPTPDPATGEAGPQQADAQQAAQTAPTDKPLLVPPVPPNVVPSSQADLNAQAIQSGMDQAAANPSQGGVQVAKGGPATMTDASGAAPVPAALPAPIDLASLLPGPLNAADYAAVVARNQYLAGKYNSNSIADQALNLVTGAMANPVNVLTPAEQAEHQALSARIAQTLNPPPTSAEARLDAMEASPLGAIASVATEAVGGSQAAQDAALKLGTAADGIGMSVAGARAGPATQFLGAQTGESVPIQPSAAVPSYTNAYPADPAVSQNAVRSLVQDNAGRWWMQSPNGQLLTPSGNVDFVATTNGQVLISKPNSNPDLSTHLGLSGGSNVSYAGSITFTNNNSAQPGSILSWTNNSGHYMPLASDAANAGLPLDRFKSTGVQ